MNLPAGKSIGRVALAMSLLFNVVVVAYLAHSGGLQRIFLKMDLVELPKAREGFQRDIEARYRKFPNTPAEIVFAGDSLVGEGPWAEYYSDVHNRGIGGETTSGMLDRLDEITESRPRKVFLMLGTNDLARQVPVAQFLRNYRALLERLRKDSPETQIYAIAITPVNSSLSPSLADRNARAAEANAQLKRLVAEFPGVVFVDLAPYLVDASGELRREFTDDGGHLNYDGYLAIREPLGVLVAGPAKVSRAGAKP